MPVSREKIDKFWLVDSVNSPPPGFWTFAADVHGSKHTLEFKEHPQPRISWIPHFSLVNKMAASVSVFHDVQGSKVQRRTVSCTAIYNSCKSSLPLQSPRASTLRPLLFHLHLNITAQTLGKSRELLGQSEQKWGR